MDKNRKIDHLVLVTDDLDQARDRYVAMGFTVAPNGRHPFGTQNANIYLGDGSMVETLTMADKIEYGAAIKDDNTFVINDKKFRQLFGDNGFSHIVATATDALADDVAFRQANVSGGSVVDFSRAFKTLDGRTETVTARLAFATDPDARGAYFFTCQEIASPSTGNASLLDHKNGTQGMAQVISCAARPDDHTNIYGMLYGPPSPTESGTGRCFRTPNGDLYILTPDETSDLFGIQPDNTGPHLRHCGFVLRVSDLSKTSDLLKKNGIEHHGSCGNVVVPSDKHGGAFVAFSAI